MKAPTGTAGTPGTPGTPGTTGSTGGPGSTGSTGSPGSPCRHLLLAGFFVFVVSLLPFLRTLPYGFVNLDDYDYVAAHAEVARGLAPPHVAWALTHMGDGIWMPLTWISYMLDCSLRGGPDPTAMRAVNIGLHGLNAVLLFLLLGVLFNSVESRPESRIQNSEFRMPEARKKNSAFWILNSGFQAAALAAATLFWSLHPLRVEPVVWVASRKDVLFAFWELLALLAWLKRLDPDNTPRHRMTWHAAALGCFALACLSKPSAMTFPLLAGLVEFGRTGRLRLRDYTLPVVVACVIGALAAHAQEIAGATLALAHVPFYGRLWNAIAAFGIYCWKTLLPADLAVQCQHRWPAPPRFWAEGLALCTGYAVALLWSARRSIRATERDTPTPPHASTGDRQECLSYLDGTAPADSSGCTGMDRQECLSYLAADDTEVVPPALRLGETPRPTSAPLHLCVQSTQSTRLATKIEPLELPNFKTPKLFTGLAFFLVAVAPTLGLSNFGVHAYADRFTYLPAAGFSMLLAALWPARWRPSRPAACALAAAALAVLAALAAASWRQSACWRDDLTLFSRTLAVDGERNVLANINLGMYHYEHGHDIEKAIPCFEQALAADEKKSGQIYPLYIICLCEAGRVAEARLASSRLLDWSAARIDEMRARGDVTAGRAGQPRRAVANYVAFAAVAIADGDYALAREHLEILESLRPGSVFAHYLRGCMASRQNDDEAAARYWRQALESRTEPYLKHRFLKERVTAPGP